MDARSIMTVAFFFGETDYLLGATASAAFVLCAMELMLTLSWLWLEWCVSSIVGSTSKDFRKCELVRRS